MTTFKEQLDILLKFNDSVSDIQLDDLASRFGLTFDEVKYALENDDADEILETEYHHIPESNKSMYRAGYRPYTH